MLDSLKKTGEKIGHEISRAWDSLSEGWRELLSRSSESLTKFTRHKEEAPAAGSALATFPSWSLLAGELEETSEGCAGADRVARHGQGRLPDHH